MRKMRVGVFAIVPAPPPIGVVLFVTAKVANISFERVTKATFPFLLPLFIVLLLITLFPDIVLFLPRVILGIQ